MAGLFESFYQQFVLRDLFSKVLPAAVVLVSTIWTLRGELTLEPLRVDVPWFQSGLCVGALWLLGLALQQFGRLLGLCQYHPKERSHEDFLARKVRISMRAPPECRREIERFVVIKEATGNTGTALALSAVSLFGSGALVRERDLVGAAIACAVLAFLLLRFHRHMVKGEDLLTDISIEHLEAVQEQRRAN